MLDGETNEEKGTVEQLLVSPLRYFTDACLGILLKGAGVGLIWDSILGILLVGAQRPVSICGAFDVSSNSRYYFSLAPPMMADYRL